MTAKILNCGNEIKIMFNKTCNSCSWFVEEVENEIGNYQHEEAVRLGRGFCLIKDFFTMQKPTDKACKDFNEEKNENKK